MIGLNQPENRSRAQPSMQFVELACLGKLICQKNLQYEQVILNDIAMIGSK